jgi:RHS repeat-associated protein
MILLNVNEAGYAFIYVSNENPEIVDVYFDDFKVTHTESRVLQADDYYPGGLTFNDWQRIGVKENKYLYQGKEEQEELATYDFGARMYDPAIIRTFQTDPMSEMFYDHSPYSWLKNNLTGRIDHTGMTDFTFNKKSGEVTQVGKANDEPDRILKTNNKGEVKYKKNGDARVAMGGIEQGILKDGQNWKTDDQAIDVGGEGQASLDGVEDFVTRFSEHVGVEIAGAYLSQEDKADASISKVIIDEYQGNESKKSTMTINRILASPELKGYNTITAFHTHPSNLNISRLDVERPSGTTDGRGDLGFRDGMALVCNEVPASSETVSHI